MCRAVPATPRRRRIPADNLHLMGPSPGFRGGATDSDIGRGMGPTIQGNPMKRTPLKRTPMKRSAPKKRSKLAQSARGQQCQTRIPGACNGNPETTVLAHLPGGGMGAKRLDLHGAYACSGCHDVIDGRGSHPQIYDRFTPNEIRLFHYEGVMRTQELMLDAGLITIT